MLLVELKAAAVDVVAEEAVTPTDVDMRPMLTGIATKKPCVFYLPIFVASTAQIIRQAPEIPGLKGTHIIGGSAVMAPGLLEAAGDAAKDFIITNVDISPEAMGKKYPEFVEKYKAKYGEGPINAFHAQAYDAAARERLARRRHRNRGTRSSASHEISVSIPTMTTTARRRMSITPPRRPRLRR